MLAVAILANGNWSHALHASHGLSCAIVIGTAVLMIAALVVGFVKVASFNRQARQASEADSDPEQHEAAGWIVADGDPSPVAVVEIQEERRTEGKQLVWVETNRSLKVRPFLIRQGPGRRVAVEPGPDPVLVDVPVVKKSRKQRTKRLAMSAEAMVYATGKLVAPDTKDDPGAYRAAGPTTPRLVRPAGGPMILSAASRVDRAYLQANQWRRLTQGVFVLFLLVQVLGLGPFYFRQFGGETVQVPFVSKRIQRGKSTTYYVKVRRAEDGREEEYVASTRTYGAANASRAIPMRIVRGMPILDQFGEQATVSLGILALPLFVVWVWSGVVFSKAWRDRKRKPEDEMES